MLGPSATADMTGNSDVVGRVKKRHLRHLTAHQAIKGLFLPGVATIRRCLPRTNKSPVREMTGPFRA